MMVTKYFILTMMLLFPAEDKPATIENYREFGAYLQMETCKQEGRRLASEFNRSAGEDFEGYAYFSCLEVDIPSVY